MQNKNNLRNIRLFLRRLFYDTPAVSVIFVVIMVTIAGYLIYSKEENNDSAKTTAEFQSNQVQTKKHIEHFIKDAEKDKPQTADNSEPASKEDDSKEIFSEQAEKDILPGEEELILQFEEDALIKTPAVRVEVRRPGHILFAINRSDLDKMPKIMEQLAGLYMDTVNKSKAVTVHFMVGGGVRGVHTFLPD